MTDQSQYPDQNQNQDHDASERKKLSDEAVGLILLFAAIPLIAYIKWVYNDNVALGAVASFILAGAAIVLRRKYG